MLMVMVIVDKPKYGQILASQALKTLVRFMKKDERMFEGFNLSKPMLFKLDLEPMLMSANEEYASVAMDAAYFFMRNYEQLDYSDFSGNPLCNTKV